MNNLYIPTTMVSSGISSMKHFFSVSPMWKNRPETAEYMHTITIFTNKHVVTLEAMLLVVKAGVMHTQKLPRTRLEKKCTTLCT